MRLMNSTDTSSATSISRFASPISTEVKTSLPSAPIPFPSVLLLVFDGSVDVPDVQPARAAVLTPRLARTVRRAILLLSVLVFSFIDSLVVQEPHHQSGSQNHRQLERPGRTRAASRGTTGQASGTRDSSEVLLSDPPLLSTADRHATSPLERTGQ